MSVADAGACVFCGGDVSRRVFDHPVDFEYGADWRGAVMACERCGLGHQVPMPSVGEALSFYPAEYVHYTPSPTGGLRERLNRLYVRRPVSMLRDAGAGPGKTVLDVGCGGGEKSSVLRDALGTNVIGIEPNAQAAQAARERYGLDVRVGTLDQVVIEDESIDVVLINHVIEHLPDPVGFLARIHRLLRSGGAVVGGSENVDCPSFRLFGRYWSLLHVPYHLLFFNRRSLEEAFERSPFERFRVASVTDPTAWSLSIQNYLRRNASATASLAPRMPGYLLVSLMCVPVSWLELGRGPVFRFDAQKT